MRKNQCPVHIVFPDVRYRQQGFELGQAMRIATKTGTREKKFNLARRMQQVITPKVGKRLPRAITHRPEALSFERRPGPGKTLRKPSQVG
jgi:hypothetical protein